MWDTLSTYREQLAAGHRYRPDRTASPPWQARSGSHDDGTLAGLFLGGIGAPVCGRNLDGQFSRWHLQTGCHINQVLSGAFFSVQWSGGYFRLAGDGPAAFGGTREVYSLFPVIHESYRDENLPLEVVAEFFSPVLPEDGMAPADGVEPDDNMLPATLPVWFASITIRNSSREPLPVNTACFWPNLLGWRVQPLTPLDRPTRSWPGQTHAGNTASGTTAANESVVVQQRAPERPVRDALEGQVAIHGFEAGSDAGSTRSVEPCFKYSGNQIDRPPERQAHTTAWVEEHFRRTGCLPGTGLTWRAHWDEAMGSAVHRGGVVLPGASRRFDFVIAMDMPLIRFGEGRRWYRRYTEAFGTSGRNAGAIARYAAEHRDTWREAIDRWHRTVLEGRGGPGRVLRGTMLNELYFVNGGGSAWVSRWARELDEDEGFGVPLLGGGEHAAILEGYDVGYYYYNTSDLWPYAWYALARWWPRFADLIFDDLLRTIPLKIDEQHLIYRTESVAPQLVAGKLPHDLGAVPEDPWHRINGYQMRDDSNLWKDHNPGFVISLYLRRRMGGVALSPEEWGAIREAALFMLAQDADRDGLPRHDEFGDSTWDNLGIRGRSAYSGSITIAAWAALVVWAEAHQDREIAEECRQRLNAAQHNFVAALWDTGRGYFRLSDTGKYADCVMGDGVLGFFLADRAGLGNLIASIDREQIRSHLRSVYRYCVQQYHQGRVGSLLVAAPGKTRFAGDGGDELQVNEVLVGSSWMVSAMLYHYGLESEGETLAEALSHQIHDRSGSGAALQFRTPAAIDGERRFRAPLNMRPLAIWFLEPTP